MAEPTCTQLPKLDKKTEQSDLNLNPDSFEPNQAQETNILAFS